MGKQPGTGEGGKPGCDFRRVQQGAPEGWLQPSIFPKALMLLSAAEVCQDRMDIPGLTSSPRMRGRAGSRSPGAILQEEQQLPEAEARPDGCQGRGMQKSGSKGGRGRLCSRGPPWVAEGRGGSGRGWGRRTWQGGLGWEGPRALKLRQRDSEGLPQVEPDLAGCAPWSCGVNCGVHRIGTRVQD